MPDDPHVTVELGNEETSIEFPVEGITTSVAITSLGQGQYRLDTVPLMVESASFRDIIEADRLPEGGLKFIRVVRKSDWRIYDFILNQAKIDGPEFRDVLDRVTEYGGHWERVFGGCLFICIPPHVQWDPTPEVVG